MDDKRKNQAERIARRYAHLIEMQTGKAVRPYRADGYVNMMNKYGTSKDTSEAYHFRAEPVVPDELLTMYYEGNGLFAKIIDTPAEEAIKHGFTLENTKDQKIEDFCTEALDELDWEETAMTAIRWARLFGGSIAVMMINDGRGIDEPLDWRNIQSIDDLRVYDRSVIQPDYQSMFSYDPRDPFMTRGSRLGMPEFYHVTSRTGSFTVHDSRCLVFQNGILPENTTNSIYQLWGIPEYVRISRAIRDAEVAHGSATKLLDRSVQAVYKMKDLAAELATEEGEDRVLRRLQTIDMARGLMNSITIDSEGEDYDFRQFQFSGVSDVIDSTCNFLSALTSIPQTILFGRSPAGMNATGDADLENWYNYLERIQKRMVKKNLRYLLSVIFQAGVRTGEVDEVPKIKISFNPLWSLSDAEQADLDQKRAQTQLTRAQTAQLYIDKQVIDPSEVRAKLADSEEFDVENMLDEYDDEDLFANMPAEGGMVPGDAGQSVFEQGQFAEYAEGASTEEHKKDPGGDGDAPAAAPAATKLPQDMSDEERKQSAANTPQNLATASVQAAKGDGNTSTPEDTKACVGVLVASQGMILTGTRKTDFGYGLIAGPGGHVKDGETPESAAFRETEEEFGISPKELLPLGRGPSEPETGIRPHVFLCTDFEGEPNCVDGEMADPQFRTLEEIELLTPSLFQPFADDVTLLKTALNGEADPEGIAPFVRDGGPGSGNFGHAGVPGEVGGSAPSGKQLNDSINEAWNSGDSDEVSSAMRKNLRSMAAGQSFELNGLKTVKIDDDTFEAETPFGDEKVTATLNETADSVADLFAEDDGGMEAPIFLDAPRSQEKPEAFKGGQVVDISADQFQNLRSEIQAHTGEETSNAEVKEYLEAIDAYRGTDYVGVVAASAGFKDGYEGYSGQMSEAEKAKAVKQAETMERFIQNADKYEGKTMRALGFDLGGDYDRDGQATKQFETLISKCNPGETIDMGHISSWTTSKGTVDQILSARTGNDESAEKCAQVVFTCPNSKNGVDIGRFSKAFSQGEVAFSKDQKFVVKSVRKSEIGDDDLPITRYEIEVAEAGTRGDEKTVYSDEKTLDIPASVSTIKLQNTSDAHNDYGVPGMKWGVHKAEVEKKLVGRSTADGVKIERVSNHAFDRVDERKLDGKVLDDLMATTKTTPGNTNRTRCYEIPGYRMVLDTKSGTVVTVMKRSNNK